MRKRDYFLSGCLFAMGLGISSGAMACATTQWDDTQGSATPGSPDPVGTTARVEQLCALAVSGGSGYVQDNSPIEGEDARIRLRFYFLADSGAATDEVVILEAFKNQANPGDGSAFTISYKPSGVDKISFNPTGGAASAVNAPSGWVLVEVDWKSGSYLRYWVNASPNPAEDNFTGQTDFGTAATVGMVRLGAPNGMGQLAKLTFDSYQANRTNPIGGLLIGDANADVSVDIFDYGAVQTEILGTLQIGQPDCNLDGSVDIFDYSCIQTIILGS